MPKKPKITISMHYVTACTNNWHGKGSRALTKPFQTNLILFLAIILGHDLFVIYFLSFVSLYLDEYPFFLILLFIVIIPYNSEMTYIKSKHIKPN